ncbi:phosphomannomutase [Rickettsiella massiliensis]|uniref:phosphomannomutase n=1 Tax=Rickettsiella massiliensis TaxID=676517 RepID=UPI00029A7B72
MENLLKLNCFPDAEQLHTLDGLRVEYKEGWGLIRASNTSPYLILRFEAETQTALIRIQRRFAEVLLAIKPDFSLPFSV